MPLDGATQLAARPTSCHLRRTREPAARRRLISSPARSAGPDHNTHFPARHPSATGRYPTPLRAGSQVTARRGSERRSAALRQAVARGCSRTRAQQMAASCRAVGPAAAAAHQPGDGRTLLDEREGKKPGWSTRSGPRAPGLGHDEAADRKEPAASPSPVRTGPVRGLSRGRMRQHDGRCPSTWRRATSRRR